MYITTPILRGIPVWTATCLLCMAVLRAKAEQRQNPPIVKIESGLVAGVYSGSPSKAAMFLGIPYAAPPVGELRWKAPQPAQKWTGIRSATRFGSPCPQLPARYFKYLEGSEDCLYLNIWTPNLRQDAELPVLVYIHGGSNTQGYGQMTPLGPVLSRMGVLVVSINYRLGPFGFFAHPLLTAESQQHSSGNYGLLDQLLALRWVKENIRKFGGDPSRVTVMGQSAGAVDICLLMASPLSRGLFRAAILQSGECQGSLNEDIRTAINYNFIDSTGEASGLRLANDLGLFGSSDLAKLRQVSSDAILKAWKNDPGLHFDAVVDGWIVPRQPAQIFAEGKQLHIPILVGSNADEATVFPHADLKTRGDYKAYLRRDTGKDWNEEFQLYPAASDADIASRAVQLESDEFAVGAYSIAEAMSKAGQKAYLYYFTYADPRKPLNLGAHHGEELFFLSDSFPDGWDHSASDKHLGALMRGYWVAFVKTGDPNSNAAPHWAAYDGNSEQYFELGEHIGLVPVSERIRGLAALMKRVIAGADDSAAPQNRMPVAGYPQASAATDFRHISN